MNGGGEHEKEQRKKRSFQRTLNEEKRGFLLELSSSL
jgi:hypothetical protein